MPRRRPSEDASPRDLFLHSVERCTASADFIPAFYERFLGASEEIRAKFRNTDFEQQNRMLAHSLKLCAGASSGDPEALDEIRNRALTHNRHNLNIEPRHYDTWLEAIVDTASRFDPQWTDTIEAAWRTVLGHVVQHMIRKY